MKFRNDIAIEHLRALFRLERATGCLFWRERLVRSRADKTWNIRFAGQEAGTNSQGYRQVYIHGKPYKVHRVIFALTNGRWPDGEVDHAERSPADNRPHKLRGATHAENMRNSKMRKNNASGVKGVCFDKRRQNWIAYIDADKHINLGRFKTLKEATAAVSAARILYHKEFAHA